MPVHKTISSTHSGSSQCSAAHPPPDSKIPWSCRTCTWTFLFSQEFTLLPLGSWSWAGALFVEGRGFWAREGAMSSRFQCITEIGKFRTNLIDMMGNTPQENFGSKNLFMPLEVGTSGYPVSWTLPVSVLLDSLDAFQSYYICWPSHAWEYPHLLHLTVLDTDCHVLTDLCHIGTILCTLDSPLEIAWWISCPFHDYFTSNCTIFAAWVALEDATCTWHHIGLLGGLILLEKLSLKDKFHIFYFQVQQSKIKLTSWVIKTNQAISCYILIGLLLGKHLGPFESWGWSPNHDQAHTGFEGGTHENHTERNETSYGIWRRKRNLDPVARWWF